MSSFCIRAGALLSLLITATSVSGADVATLPAPEELIAALRSDDHHAKALAEGQLYLLPESAFPALEATLAKRLDQVPGPLEKALCRAMVLRGHPPAVKACAQALLDGGGSMYAYCLPGESLLAATPDELMPLARACAEAIPARKPAIAYQGNEIWVSIAGRSGETQLMRLALALAASAQGRFALPNMAGRFDPDRCAAALLPAMSQGTVESRLGYIRLLRKGWSQGPDRAVAGLMRDPEAQIRSIFAMTLETASSSAALELAIQGLGDPDANVRNTCIAAIGSFQGDPQTDLLRKLATNERIEPAMRVQAWAILHRIPGDLLLAEAKDLVSGAKTDRSLRDIAIVYLLQRQGARWLLDAVPRLEPMAKAEVLTALARSGSVEMLSVLPAFLRKADPVLAGQVVQSLASIKDQQVLPLLIGLLDDPRAEIRRAAANGLGNATGLSYYPVVVGGDPAKAEAASIKALHDAWSRWYDVFAAPPAAPLAADLVTCQAALLKRETQDETPLPVLNGEAYPVLLRLSGDRKVGGRALAALVRLGDPRTAVTLVGLLDGPTFSNRRDELTRALMRCRLDAAVVPQLIALLDHPDSRWLAIRVLVAWRMSSPALIQAIFAQGSLDRSLIADLASWKDCPVVSAARKLLTDTKAEEGQRSQALALLVQLGDERDVKALGQKMAEGGSAAHYAVRGLVRMAMDGVASASQELERVLAASSVRKPAAKPPRAPAKQPAEKPDLAPTIIAALRDRPRNGQGGSIPLPDSLLAAVRIWTKGVGSPEQQLAGLALLLEAIDPSGIDVLRTMLDTAEHATVKQAFDLVLGSRSPDARPYVDLLQALPDLNGRDIFRLTSWYREVAKVPAAEREKIAAALRATQDRRAGQPVRGLVLSVDFQGASAPLGAKGLKAKVQIRNVGKKPCSFAPEHVSFTMKVQRLGDDQGEFMRDVRINHTSKPNATGGTPPTVIAPGQSFHSTITFDAPDEHFAAAAHRVRLIWRVPASLGSNDTTADTDFMTPWTELTFIPTLWEAIDRRSLGR